RLSSLCIVFQRDITRLCHPEWATIGSSALSGVKMSQLSIGPIVMSNTRDADLDAVSSQDISPVTEIVAELRAGRMVILVDEEDRENEGDLVMAAEHVTPEAINFMVTHARGLVCLTLTEERCKQLDLPLMASRNGTRFGTNFTMSIEAAEGVETGISAADRARTIRTAVARDAKPSDLVQPAHIFPVQAARGG